jgi:arginine decarboxylase
MGLVRIVWGDAMGPTATASYDAALAAANVHEYNLVTVSSVLPADAAVEVIGDAPHLGPAGERLTVVQGRATAAPGANESAAAALGWSRSAEGAGIFYEASGTDPTDVKQRVTDGLEHGRMLRTDRTWTAENGLQLVTAEADSEQYVTAVVLAVYGESEPLC